MHGRRFGGDDARVSQAVSESAPSLHYRASLTTDSPVGSVRQRFPCNALPCHSSLLRGSEMSFPSSSLSMNTAPLPTAPPRPARNSRGLRADTAAPLFKSNVYTHHGQVTLLPPPNMVRVRARPDELASSSRSAAELGDDAASSIRPRRRTRQPRPSSAGMDGREEIILKPGQTASDAIKEQYRRSEASMRAPPPAPRPPPSSPSAAQQVRRARQRAGTAGLSRGASMMRRNVQEGKPQIEGRLDRVRVSSSRRSPRSDR